MDNNVTKKDFLFFQDDILREFKNLESQLTKKISASKKDIEDKTISLEENLSNMKQKILEINETCNKITNDNSENNNKTDNSIKDFNIKNEFLINNIKKELDEACFKYDRIFISNLNVPGLIGDSCPFPNVKFFLEYANKKIIEALSLKERQEAEFKSYRQKMENIINQNKKQLQQIETKIINYIKGAINNCDKECENRMKVIEERINIMRIENSKYSANLIKKTDEVKIKWEKLDGYENKINQMFQDETYKMRFLIDDIKTGVNSQQEEFFLIKARFKELSEFIKDVRFRKNIKSIFNEMHKFKEMSDKLDFNKKQKLDKDKYNTFSNNFYKGKDANKNDHVSINCEENNNIEDISQVKNVISHRNEDIENLYYMKEKNEIINVKNKIKDNSNIKKEIYEKKNFGNEIFGNSADNKDKIKSINNNTLEKKGMENKINKEKLLIKAKLYKNKDISKNKDLIYSKNILNNKNPENNSEYAIFAESEISNNSPKNKNPNSKYFSKTEYKSPILITQEETSPKKSTEKKTFSKNVLLLEESNPISITLNSIQNKQQTKKEVIRSETMTSLNDNKENSNPKKINKINKKEIQKILDNPDLNLPKTERYEKNNNYSLSKLLKNDNGNPKNIPYKKDSVKLILNNLIETPHEPIFKNGKFYNEKLFMTSNSEDINDKISKMNEKLGELLGYVNQKFLSIAEDISYLSKEIHNLYKIKAFNNNVAPISSRTLYTKNGFTLPMKLNLSSHKNNSSINIKEKIKTIGLNNNKKSAVEIINVIEPYLVKKFK